ASEPTAPPTTPQAPPPPPAPEPERTRIAAGDATPPPPPPEEMQTQFTTRDSAKGIRVGDVLNHIFEVKRFIARGGMGEVFEGQNINSDERVAIKVVLPALASNEHVIAMFQREARTLTRLQHRALVQYRVLAKEPRLGVLYIV